MIFCFGSLGSGWCVPVCEVYVSKGRCDSRQKVVHADCVAAEMSSSHGVSGVQKVDPKSDGAARDWVAIYDECSRILFEEIDYRMEAEYASSFAANFAGVDWVKVPEIERELLAPEVLVMEYVPGVKINNAEAIDAMGLDRDRLARLSVESYLQQLLRHGLFHADPHPGNVAVDATNGGRLIYYDFGMMGRIQPFVRCAPLRRPCAADVCVCSLPVLLWRSAVL